MDLLQISYLHRGVNRYANSALTTFAQIYSPVCTNLHHICAEQSWSKAIFSSSVIKPVDKNTYFHAVDIISHLNVVETHYKPNFLFHFQRQCIWKFQLLLSISMSFSWQSRPPLAQSIYKYVSRVKRESKTSQAADYSPSKAAPSDNLSKEIASWQAIKSCLDKTTAFAGA